VTLLIGDTRVRHQAARFTPRTRQELPADHKTDGLDKRWGPTSNLPWRLGRLADAWEGRQPLRPHAQRSLRDRFHRQGRRSPNVRRSPSRVLHALGQCGRQAIHPRFATALHDQASQEADTAPRKSAAASEKRTDAKRSRQSTRANVRGLATASAVSEQLRADARGFRRKRCAKR